MKGYLTDVTFHSSPDTDECQECPENFWSNENSTLCYPQKSFFLSWKDKYCITILVFACLGLLLTLIVMLVFLVRRDTPVVLAAGGPISILILLSLPARDVHQRHLVRWETHMHTV